jgi:Leucine-rich repeat (LRR) protein
LQIQHNELDAIPPELLTLPYLTTLDLADNLIEKIPEDISKLSKMQTLSLWDNPISYYPGTLSELTELKVLDLLHNDISNDTQSTLKSILPGVKLIMSPPCPCNDGGE